MVLRFVAGLVLDGEGVVDLRAATSTRLTWDLDSLADLDLIRVGDLGTGRFQLMEGYSELLCYVGEGVARLDCIGGHPERF